MDQIEGLKGELIGRLVELLNCDALGGGAWYDVTTYAVVFLGGNSLDKVTPDTGRAPAPGTVGERERQLYELVSRERYIGLIQHRLRELVASGVEEAFLVRSIRDATRRELEHMADVGTGDRNRAALRDRLLRAAEGPAEISRFRARIADSDPSTASLSDDEISAMMRKSAEGASLNPTSPESATGRWAMLDHWDEQVALLLPDAVFDEWYSQVLRRSAKDL